MEILPSLLLCFQYDDTLTSHCHEFQSYCFRSKAKDFKNRPYQETISYSLYHSSGMEKNVDIGHTV